jgi:hypothetical protein
VQNFPHREAALLIGPDHERLMVLARPLRPGRFLVAALAPPGVSGALHLHHAPRGIAVPGDPARAEAAIERRLLPRYRQAVETVRGPALEEAHLLAQEALDSWDAISDSLCDEHGVPLDEDAYGVRQVQRDAEAWGPFETFLALGPAAIHDAHTALTALTLPASTRDRWSHQLRELGDALAEGTRIRDEWNSCLADLLEYRSDPRRRHVFDRARATRNAEAWHAITIFIDYAPVLDAIREAEQRQVQGETVGEARTTAARSGNLPAPPPPTRPALPPHTNTR